MAVKTLAVAVLPADNTVFVPLLPPWYSDAPPPPAPILIV